MIEAIIQARGRRARTGLTRAGLGVSLLLLSACSHLRAHWPWHRAAAPPPPAVTELLVESSSGALAPVLRQTWDRNALRVSLEDAAGEGELKLRPVPGHGWPIRLEFAVRPGAFGHLELRGEQRVIMAVPASGGETVLPVPQGVYAPATTALTVRYGP